MNKTLLGLLLLAGLFFTSCVPVKDLTYLQRKDKNDTLQAINPVMVKPYRVQTNDVLMISIKALDPKLVEVFQVTNAQSSSNIGTSEASAYLNGFIVDDHGNIRMPILEEVNVLGFTIEEVRKKVEERLLEEYFNKEANIFVSVKLSGLNYVVNGEVGSPGANVIYKERATIMEAIAVAGDITITGDRHHVLVVRQFPHGTEMHEIDLTDVKALQSPYYYIKSNDFIYVKPLKQKSWGTGKTGIESLSTIISVLTLVTTTLLLISRN